MIKKICNAPSIVAIIYFLSVFLAAVLFSHFEDKSLEDSIWWSFITSLTIGYGDIYPTTTEGRIVGVSFSLFWVFFIIPAVIANVLSRMLENRDAFTHLEQEWQEDALQAIAKKLELDLPAPPKDW